MLKKPSDSTRANLRNFIMVAIAAVVATVASTKVGAPAYEAIAHSVSERVTCRAFWGNTSLDRVAAADPVCARLLSKE